MRLYSSLIFLILGSPVAYAKDPLEFIPAESGAVLKIEKPRAFVEAVARHALAKEAQGGFVVRDMLDRSEARRFFQLVEFYEHKLGSAWTELIDKLAGSGIAIGLKSLEPGAPVLIAIQGTDEAAADKFFALALEAIEEGGGDPVGATKLARRKHRGIECVEIEKALKLARVGTAIFAASTDDTLNTAIDLATANSTAKTMAAAQGRKDAAKVLPTNPVAWAWVDLKPIKARPDVKELLETPRTAVIPTLLASDVIDAGRRSDFLAAGLYHSAGDFRLAVRLPAGRDGTAPDVEIYAPKSPSVAGSLPLLEPKGVLFSHSFYMDLEPIYSKRDQILPPQISKDLAEREKQISGFLPGTTLQKYLAASGAHHRLVIAQPEAVGAYKTKPARSLASFALITSMRDPEFAKTTTSLIRTGVPLAKINNISLDLWEEPLAGVPAFGYSFSETVKFPADVRGQRFNYQPAFAAVRGQFIFASNKGLCKELIELIQKEDRSKPSHATMQTCVYSSGAGEFLNRSPEQVLAGTILSQGLPVGEAKKQTDALFTFVQKLGTTRAVIDWTADEFRLDVQWKTGK